MQNPSIKFYIYETSNINIEDNFVATKCLRLNDEIKEITAEPPQDIIDATSFSGNYSTITSSANNFFPA